MIRAKIKKLARKIVKKILPDINFSYSQFGEDLIISHLFHQVNIDKPIYLDIGANHPRYISNTYYFYERGGHGVCVEPNPVLYGKLARLRKRDTIINAGIGLSNEAEADFYLFPYYAHGLSTFSEKEANHWSSVGMKGMGKINYEKKMKMPLISINTLIKDHLKNAPDLLSIDVEGLDFDILNSLDFDIYKPKVICAETLAYDENQKGYKNNTIAELLLSKGYFIYADTYVNTIFCLNELL